MKYTSAVIESTKPFRVRASCGHITIRRMREATAGVPYTEETILEAPNGRACDHCEMPHASDCSFHCGDPCDCITGKRAL